LGTLRSNFPGVKSKREGRPFTAALKFAGVAPPGRTVQLLVTADEVIE
jgi:hypothetical protein